MSRKYRSGIWWIIDCRTYCSMCRNLFIERYFRIYRRSSNITIMKGYLSMGSRMDKVMRIIRMGSGILVSLRMELKMAMANSYSRTSTIWS